MPDQIIAPAIDQKPCPKCGAIMPVNPDYVTWCDQCEWNLQPQKIEKSLNLFESFYLSIGDAQSKKLLSHLQRRESLKPILTFSKAIAYLVATAVHAITLIFFIWGLKLLLFGSPYLLRFPEILFGVLFLLIAINLRPRFSKLRTPYAPRDAFPALYALVDKVSETLHTKPVHGIVINGDYNASFARVGWQRKKVLFIGYALWSALDNQERIALLGHEIAHDVNGDGFRGFYIGTAVSSLLRWYSVIYPHDFDTRSAYALFLIPLNVIRFGLAKLVYLVAYLLAHLLWRDSQRAEYYADYLAATVAGTNAALGMLNKLHFTGAFLITVRNITLNWDKQPKDLFAELQGRITKMPTKELERIRRIETKESSRLDTTHPPTPYRIQQLESHLITEPMIMAESIDFAAIEQEMSHVRDKMAKELMSWYSSSLY